METLLRIDASARYDGSHTRELADHFEADWLAQHSGSRVIRRDLAQTPPPHLTQADIGSFFGFQETPTPVSDELVSEIKLATHLLVATPVYNFEVPSSLKGYLDQVVRFGHTFESVDGEFRGLLTQLGATVIVALGGNEPTGVELPCSSLHRCLGFMGVSRVDAVTLSQTSIPGVDVAERMTKAKGDIDGLFGVVEQSVWAGEVDNATQADIAKLRRGQTEAILAGDAQAYADLCTDDVTLMLPGFSSVRGRSDLLHLEQELFEEVKFCSFRKVPERIECHGNVVIETGMQTVATTPTSVTAAVTRATQKYTHIYRKDAGKWKISLLMSNHC